MALKLDFGKLPWHAQLGASLTGHVELAARCVRGDPVGRAAEGQGRAAERRARSQSRHRDGESTDTPWVPRSRRIIKASGKRQIGGRMC